MYQATETSIADRLEALALPAGNFTHAAHVESAWIYLTDPNRGADAFRCALLRFVDHHGARDKYHETMTAAYLQVISARLRLGESWEGFSARNQDLLQQPGEILAQHYSAALLESSEARQTFVAPDRAPLPRGGA